MNITEMPLSGELLTLLEAADLPASDLREGRPATFLAAMDDDELLGCVGYELGGAVALLRSLAVRPEAQGKGLGRVLVAEAERHARDAGAMDMFLLTTTAAPFFEQLGFDRIAREVAPTFIAKSPQILGLCPGSAVLLTKPL